jgi:hypothetical protein
MNTIVVNTLNGAVSEYTGFGFQSITPTHAGSATGLFELGGDTDNGVAIVSRAQTGETSWGTSLKKSLAKAFFGLSGEGAFSFHVAGKAGEWEYPIGATSTGEQSAQPGRGIRETYVSFGFSNPDGQQFQLDSIELVEFTSTSRRV